MSKKGRLAKKLAESEQRLNRIEREIDKVSASRLAEFLKLSPEQQFEHINDADLTSAHRDQLRSALQRSIHRRNFRENMFWRVTRAIRAILRIPRPGFNSVYAFTVVLCAVFYSLSVWRNTGESIVLPRSTVVDWILPAGTSIRQQLLAGSQWAVVREHDGSYTARYWYPREGYAMAPLGHVRE